MNETNVYLKRNLVLEPPIERLFGEKEIIYKRKNAREEVFI
jgi:hypothetical protein